MCQPPPPPPPQTKMGLLTPTIPQWWKICLSNRGSQQKENRRLKRWSLLKGTIHVSVLNSMSRNLETFYDGVKLPFRPKTIALFLTFNLHDWSFWVLIDKSCINEKYFSSFALIIHTLINEKTPLGQLTAWVNSPHPLLLLLILLLLTIYIFLGDGAGIGWWGYFSFVDDTAVLFKCELEDDHYVNILEFGGLTRHALDYNKNQRTFTTSSPCGTLVQIFSFRASYPMFEWTTG